ncbi:MAG: hypothetical protein GY795_03425 [Desulfobacterales bacterium]|nr:hypothetical protein [Desulfobacterales bacterium]
MIPVSWSSNSQCIVTSSSDWKNTVDFPHDSFMNYGTANWIKFTVLLCDSETVYFQDSKKYQFHYEFAKERLDPFLGVTQDGFNQATLFTEAREAILGAVITPPSSKSDITEFGIQFVGDDPLDPETVVKYFSLVRSAVNAEPTVKAFYFPSYNQVYGAEQNREYLESHGISIGSADRWGENNICYSKGWALGKLKYFEGSAINDAYLSGALGPGDILLTDGVPSEIPFVAGIISLSPSTPNSHTAILASTYGIPFVYLRLADDADIARKLVGRRITLRAYGDMSGDYDYYFPPYYVYDGKMTAGLGYYLFHYGSKRIDMTDIEGVLDEETIKEILALKNPQELSIQPVVPYSTYSSRTDILIQKDIRYFGGKAANFGFLRRTIPDNSPVSAAFSFNLWNEFLDQNLKTGTTFREEIRNRLTGITYPPDMASLSETLKGIRDMFKDEDSTSFTDAQKQAVISVLQDYRFDINKKIRFRSSTNVEDSEQFTGAGLYDSFSGCLADDLDGDITGPSICDPSKEKERGVFRAIRKVFASFYNDNAFVERLRHEINEDNVGMALLVHHSFPDETELANGVATLEISQGVTQDITLVTQTGAVSVTNPDNNAIPEEVDVGVFENVPSSAYMATESNLVMLGGTVMSWDDDYISLSRMLISVAEAFGQATGKTEYVLDFEYKKIAPDGKLVIKQVREIPQPDTTPDTIPFLINEPTEYCVFQGEKMDIFALYRLKSRLTLETGSIRMTEDNLAKGLNIKADLEYMIDGQVFKKSGMLSEWPDASYVFKDNSATVGWTFSDSLNPRSYSLKMNFPNLLVSASESPLLTSRDFGLFLQAEYEMPVPTYEDEVKNDEIILVPCPREDTDGTLQERTMTGPDGLVITTSFYWFGIRMDGGFTAPAMRWKQTVISGLTSEPVILRNYFSQTYSPSHHNFTERFIFDPFLDPDVPHHLLTELRSKEIRMILVNCINDPWSGYPSKFTFYKDSSVKGDINHDGKVDMADAILGLQSLTNSNSRVIYLNSDVNGDAKIGMAEVIYSLQKESEK